MSRKMSFEELNVESESLLFFFFPFPLKNPKPPLCFFFLSSELVSLATCKKL